MNLANQASLLALALAINLLRKKDGDGQYANLRLQNGSPQMDDVIDAT